MSLAAESGELCWAAVSSAAGAAVLPGVKAGVLFGASFAHSPAWGSRELPEEANRKS